MSKVDTSGLCLLIVVGEVYKNEHKEFFIDSVVEDLGSVGEASGQDINSFLQKALDNFQISQENEEKIFTYKSEEIFIEVLLKPQLRQLLNKLESFFTHPSSYHHLIYTGSCIKGTTKLLLSDAIFSNFTDVFKSSEVLNAIKDGSLKGVVCINSKTLTSLNNLSKLHPSISFKLNPPSNHGNSQAISDFRKLLSEHLTFTCVHDLLPESSVVGSIRFHRPTIYIFPAGLGASCLFAVSGFNLLVDGGYARKSCFWEFAKHLERIDTFLLTHVGEDNLFGLLSVLERKQQGVVNPEIGYVFANVIKSTEAIQIEEGKDVDIGVQSRRMVELMKEVGIQPQRCLGSVVKGMVQPINLYHKLGLGSLDLYILNPLQDSKPLKDFLTSWSKSSNPFTAKPPSLPLSSLSSVCAVVVWQPPHQPPTRILFPGTTPQQGILEALDRLSSLTIFDSFGDCLPKKITPRKSSSTIEQRLPSAKKSDTSRQKSKQPFHVDMAYIPSHGDPRMVDKDFFARVRARYYVLSTPDPSSILLTSLLEAKEGWSEEGVVIPTHDSDTLRFWVAAHHQQLSQVALSVAPAANRCTIQLQDHQTSCSAYRLEF